MEAPRTADAGSFRPAFFMAAKSFFSVRMVRSGPPVGAEETRVPSCPDEDWAAAQIKLKVTSGSAPSSELLPIVIGIRLAEECKKPQSTGSTQQ